MNYIIGTRGSKLALAQAGIVQNRLQEAYPQDTFSCRIVSTKGDQITDRPLELIGGKGLFVAEIERLLLSGEIQLAVHSMKDMPAEQTEGLIFSKAWKREDPRDVLLLREASSFDALRPGAVIGTGSKRRGFQLLARRPDLKIVNLRGNIDTRIEKMREIPLDGIVLAAAGLIRLHRESEITEYLEPEIMIPAPTQGTLAIQLREADEELLGKVNALADEETEIVSRAERLFLQGVGGDCHLPIGAYGRRLPDGRIELAALFGDAEGEKVRTTRKVGNSPESVASEALRELL